MFKQYSMKQLLLAAGLARRVPRENLCLVIGVVESYITKCLKNPDFMNIKKYFEAQPFDVDIKTYQGLGTLYKSVAKAMYSEGEKLENV